MSKTISKARLLTQSGAKHINYMEPLEVGTELKVVDYIVRDTNYNNIKKAADFLLVEDGSGRQITLPAKVYMSMDVAGGTAKYDGEDGSDDISIPTNIEITAAVDRKFNGESVYPMIAHSGHDNF